MGTDQRDIAIEARRHFSRVDRVQRAAAARSVLSFAGGLPDPHVFPRAGITRAFLRAIGRTGCSALQYGWPEGQPELRKFIAARLCARGCVVGADDVLITSGAQQAIAIAMQLVFRKSKIIRLDPETYSGALDLFRTRELTATFQLTRATGAYVMPQLDNPRGQVMAKSTRHLLLDAARRHDLMLIEDDAYADIVFYGEPTRPLLADAPDSTFHIGTFSKSLCPGLRVGWLITPRHHREGALEAKRESDLQANTLAQSILAEFFADGDYDARIAKARKLYRRRAARLADALRRHLPGWTFDEPRGGFSIWAESGESGDDVALLQRAVSFGVSFDPGSMFRVNASETLGLRLSYSCIAETSIEEGVKRLARAWKSRGRRSAA